MSLASVLTWSVLVGYGWLIFVVAPRHVKASQFFQGEQDGGREPGFWLLVASAAISWIFAKSINNAANLAQDFGLTGGIGYAIYYLSFLIAAFAIYHIRVRTGARSLSGFLTTKYGTLCARLFLIAIGIRSSMKYGQTPK